MTSNLCTETGFVSLNKFGEELCGDHVETYQDESQSLLVLADGLGSGVKANILSTLTAKIICTMLAQGMKIEDCIDTVAATLPECSERKVAYSTFSVVRVRENGMAEITQYDNPDIIVLRMGARFDYPVTLRTVGGKQIREGRFPARQGDVFVLLSDGAPYAGQGNDMNMDWQPRHIVEYLENGYRPDNAARTIASSLCEKCAQLYGGQPGDDTTAAVLRVRGRRMVNLVIGPPADKAQDSAMMNLFFAKEGDKIVCGGTTAAIAARYLGKPVEDVPGSGDPAVPPISRIEGVELVTEGALTLARVLEYAQGFVSGADQGAWKGGSDGASLIAQELFDFATDISFFVGRAVNPAHQHPGLPVQFGVKLRLIESLRECLEKMGKRVKVSYF